MYILYIYIICDILVYQLVYIIKLMLNCEKSPIYYMKSIIIKNNLLTVVLEYELNCIR